MENNEYRSVERFSLVVRALPKRPVLEIARLVLEHQQGTRELMFYAGIRTPERLRHVKTFMTWEQLQKMLKLISATANEYAAVDHLLRDNDITFI